jgi:hypothetical protein
MTTRKHTNGVDRTYADWLRARELLLIGLHDLKTPLSAMRTCIDLLSPGKGQPVNRESWLQLTGTLEILVGRAAGLVDVMMKDLGEGTNRPVVRTSQPSIRMKAIR